VRGRLPEQNVFVLPLLLFEGFALDSMVL